MLVAYLQDDKLTVLIGQSGTPVVVEQLLECPGLAGTVRDGVIVDAAGFQSVVGDFWRDHNLDTKDVKLVVRSRRITLQKLDAPVFRKERDLRAYLGREAQVNSRFSEPCVAFADFDVDKAAKTTHVLATVADKGLVERIVGTFGAMGVTVSAIASPHMAAIACTRQLAAPHGNETVLYLTADRDQSIATLFQKGRYQYSSEQHLFTDYGTADFGNELLHSVTNIEQFMQSEHIAQRFDRVCLFGMEQAAAQVVQQALSSYDASVAVETLPSESLLRIEGGASPASPASGTANSTSAQSDASGGRRPSSAAARLFGRPTATAGGSQSPVATATVGSSPAGSIQPASAPVTAASLQAVLPAVWGLAVADDGTELVEAYREATGTGMTRQTKSGLLAAFRLPAICLAACLVVIIGLNVANMQLDSQVDALQAQIRTPEAMEQLAAYGEAKDADDTATATVDSADRLTSGLEGYPVPGLSMERTIRSCANGLVTYRTTGYDENSGSYIIEAYATSNRNISKFVKHLADAGQRTGDFEVSNSGYQAEETTSDSDDQSTSRRWKLAVVLTLSSGEGR